MMKYNNKKNISTLEEVIHTIWSQVLTQSKIDLSRDDNFFLLGGNSLSMGQILVRLNQSLNLKLSLLEIFHLTTINKMTDYIHQLQHSDSPNTSSTCPTTRLIHKAYYASSGQCGLWYVEQSQARDKSLYNTSLRIDFNGDLDIKGLANAFNYLINRHDLLRASFNFEEISNGLRIEIGHHTESNLAIQKASKAYAEMEIKQNILTNFNFSKGRLIHAKLYILSEKKYILALTIHHIITDGWSNGILLKELACSYNEYLLKKTDLISTTPVSACYRDYCIWQKKYLAGSDYQLGLDYWRQKLQGSSSSNKLNNAPESVVDVNKSCDVYINKTVYKSMLRFSQAYSFSPFMILLTTLKILLAKYTKQFDIAIASPIANRKYQQWEAVVGYFVNLLVFRDRIDPEDSILTLLNKVKSSVLYGFHYQDVPFPEVVKELEASGKQFPLFDVLFSYQNLPKYELSFNQLEAVIKKINPVVSHYTISIEVVETTTGLNCHIEYADQLATAKLIEAMQYDFSLLLQKITKQPELMVGLLI